jgi:KaiC/GvpD/RAD55 family RecA-like ATPase
MAFPISLSGEKKLYLVMSPAEQLKTNNIEIIRQLIENEHPVLVVTLNQPYSTLVHSYEKNGLDVSKICFIDAITTYALGKFPPDAKNCRFVNNPANMTDLGIAITEMLHRYPDKKPCIVFDSISTMLIYIPSITISKFIHYVTSKLKLLNSPGVFLAVEKSLDPLLMTQLVTFVDEVIDPGTFMIPSFMPAPHNAVTGASRLNAPPY